MPTLDCQVLVCGLSLRSPLHISEGPSNENLSCLARSLKLAQLPRLAQKIGETEDALAGVLKKAGHSYWEALPQPAWNLPACRKDLDNTQEQTALRCN